MVIPAHVQTLADRGFSVIPIPPPRPGAKPNTIGDGKVPEIPWTAFQSRHPTPAELLMWFGTGRPQNVAIITGTVSGVIVVDADSREGLQWCTARLPYTPWQTRTPRGYHLFYQHPGVPVRNKAKLVTGIGTLDIDVRGDGGFVIAPGSIHLDGTPYTYAGDWTVPREAVPRFWPGWVARPTPATRPAPADVPIGSRSSDDLVERARKYLAAVPVPVIGHGSDAATLCMACRLVRGFALDAADAEALLWAWCGNRPGWTRAWVAAKVAHAERYGTEPIGALR